MNAERRWVSFVHGTTTELWQGEAILALGAGDFGKGFYVFEDTRWGREAAIAWARRKAVQTGGRPLLIRVRVEEDAWLRLTRHDVSEPELEARYREYAPDGLSGFEVVSGPVGRRGPAGRERNHTLPLQYKFEDSGIKKLVMIERIVVE